MGTPLWQFCSTPAICVAIDHGSDRSPSFALHPGTQIVSIPRGAVDHINISQFCGYFQRFLLSQYRWVIHVDSDELLVHEHGVAALLEKLDGGGYRSSRGTRPICSRPH